MSVLRSSRTGTSMSARLTTVWSASAIRPHPQTAIPRWEATRSFRKRSASTCSAPPRKTATEMPDAPRWVYRFSDKLPVQGAAATLDLIGQKGASLWSLAEAGFAVAPGFTITTDACNAYHRHGQWPAGLQEQLAASIRMLESETGRKLGDTASPLTLAVRSGAAASMPGMLATCLHCGLTIDQVERIETEETWEAFETYLSHLGWLPQPPAAHTDNRETARDRCRALARRFGTEAGRAFPASPLDSVASAVTTVFNSWNRHSAIRYRNLHGITSATGTAVTVQAMFPSRVAGVVFTRDPAEPHSNLLRVEAQRGLGTSVVLGRETPFCWQVDRDSLAIVNSPSGDAPPELQKLAEHQLGVLARDCLKIEEIFRAPVDVEWGFDRDALTFFQARPIPVPISSVQIASLEHREHARLADWSRTGRRYWVAHNLGETLPYPTPMTWSLWRQFLTGRGGLGRLYRRLGFRPSRRAGKEGVAELICGRTYAYADRYTELFCAGYPFRFDIESLRSDPAALERPPQRFDAARLDPWFLLRLPATVATLLRSRRRIRNLSRTAVESFQHEVQTDLAAALEREQQPVLASLHDEELLEHFERRCRFVFDQLAAAAFLPGTLASGAWSSLERILEESLDPDVAASMRREILAAVPNPLVDRRQHLLQRLTCDEDARHAYLAEFGHRGPDEMELASPRWRELPAMLNAHHQIHPTTEGSSPPSAEDLRDRLCQMLAGAGADYLEPRIRPRWETVLALTPYRELGKHEFLRGYALLRETLQEISARLGIGDDVYFLHCAELATSRLHSIPVDEIAHRKAERPLLLRSRPPSLIDAARPPHLFRRSEEPTGAPVHTPASTCVCRMLAPGRAAGAARIIRDDALPDRISPETILVASTVDPDALPGLCEAAALIVERGGALSHLALLARQFGIPTVVCPEATDRFTNGQSLSVNADSGKIQLRDGALD
ncbi:MAG: hypothetical protein DWQ29_23800 [Planctomycetota bacterium]|nr:MAG: hypothetical protein DWQ29_23800 [Planctomycetota bacterium]